MRRGANVWIHWRRLDMGVLHACATEILTRVPRVTEAAAT
jgi:hypothetical protein